MDGWVAGLFALGGVLLTIVAQAVSGHAASRRADQQARRQLEHDLRERRFESRRQAYADLMAAAAELQHMTWDRFATGEDAGQSFRQYLANIAPLDAAAARAELLAGSAARPAIQQFQKAFAELNSGGSANTASVTEQLIAAAREDLGVSDL